MYETDGHILDLIADTGNEVFATLVYAPKSHRFQAARKALHALGASYSPNSVHGGSAVNDDTVKPLQRLYARSSMALWVMEDGDQLSAEAFARYTG